MLEKHEHKHAVHEFDGIIENRVTTPPVYFTVLFYGLIIWGVAFMSFYLLSGWSSEAEFQEKMAAHQGEQTAQQQSAAAPPATAESTPTSTPATAESTPTSTPATAESTPTSTPATAESTPVSTPAPAVASESEVDGQALFAKHCAGCHGAEGKGAFGPDLSGDYAYGKTEMAVQESISSGRPNNMPAFEGKLTPEEIEAVADYILDL
ncbi:MAG: c-type cytochrome [Desulfuromonadales bacterium]|nr:c-type cytochrome [Desulfuromonadales bacterium]